MTTATAEVERETAAEEQTTDNVQTGASYDDINMPVVLMVGLISAIVTVVTIFFVQGLSYQWKNSYIRERSYDYVNEPVRSVVENQKALLDGQQDGIRSIDNTMAEMVEEFGKK